MAFVNGKASGTASLHRLPVMWSGFKDSSQKPIRLSQTYEMANSCARPCAECSRKFKKKKKISVDTASPPGAPDLVFKTRCVGQKDTGNCKEPIGQVFFKVLKNSA